MKLPSPKAYIEGLILEGLSVLGGKPKLGKSWWALRAAVAISTGTVAFGNGDRAVRSANVLYLALEDGPARLQDRLGKLVRPHQPWPETLMLAQTWPRFDNGGIDLLADAISIDGYEVVIIDTLGRVRSPRKGRDSYQEDTDAIALIHGLCRDNPGLAILLIHHNRKDDHPDDYIDALSGTTGITGVVDHIAVLQRGRGEADAILRFTSRDAPEHDTAYAFDKGQWTELGSAADYGLSKARRAVLDALIDFGGEGSASDIADALGSTRQNASKLLRGLAKDGLVHQEAPRDPWKVVATTDLVDGTSIEVTNATSFDPK